MDPKQLYSILERIDSKLDKVDSRLDKVDVQLAEYNLQLEYHIARTDQIEDDLLPIVRHVEQIRGMSKLIAAFMALVGVIATVWALFKS